MGDTYKIRRFYRDNNELSGETVAEGLTIDQAHAWCENPDTNSKTAIGYLETKRTQEHGPWFEGFEKE